MKNRPDGIGFLSPGWPRGFRANGIETYVANAYDALRSLGVPVYILSENTKFGFWPQHIKTLKHENYTKIVEVITAQVKKLKKEGRIEIFEMEETYGWAHGVAQDIPVPLVVKVHGPGFIIDKVEGILEDKRSIQRVKDELSSMQSAAGVTAPSRDILRRAQAYYGVEFKNTRVIPNPIKIIPEKERWKLSQCDRKKILFVGRFDRHKGADILLEAFGSILRKMPAAKLVFAGPDRGLDKDGQHWEIKEYIKRVMPVQHRGNVQWLGQVSAKAVERLRRESFLTVISSRYENFGNNLLEPMAYGCPTVASGIGGNPEIMESGRNGLLFEVENPDDLAEKALSLLGDEALAERLGKQAAEDVGERYHPQKIAHEMLDYYAEILNQK